MNKNNSWSYTAEPVRCHACAEKDRRAHQFTRGDHDPYGLMFSIKKKESDGR